MLLARKLIIVSAMADEPTERFAHTRSFAERVFARFDALDRRMDSLETHLANLDRRVQVLEPKAYDTKPIWERALAGISEVKEAVFDLDRKMAVLIGDMMQLRADQIGIARRLDQLEART